MMSMYMMDVSGEPSPDYPDYPGSSNFILKERHQIETDEDDTDSINVISSALPARWNSLPNDIDSYKKTKAVKRSSSNITSIIGRQSITHISQTGSQVAQNIFDMTVSAIEQHEATKTFIQISPFYFNAYKYLMCSRKVLLISNFGDGKTSLGLELLKTFGKTNDKITPAIINSVHEWHEVVSPQNDLVIFLDDVFGKPVLDRNMYAEWQRIFPAMNTCLNDKNGRISIIFGINRYIYNEIRDDLKRHELFRDLDNVEVIISNYEREDRENILISHINNPISDNQFFEIRHNSLENVQYIHGRENMKIIPDNVIQKILDIDVFAFPRCCFSFVNERKYLTDGPHFFQNPMTILFPLISSLCRTDGNIFLILAIILFSDLQKVNVKTFQEKSTSYSINELFLLFGIKENTKHFMSRLRKISRNMTGVLLKEEYEEIGFISKGVCNSFVVAFGKEHTQYLIENVECSLLLRNITTRENCQSENLYIRQEYYEILVERMANELENASVEIMIRSKILLGKNFIEKFLTSIKSVKQYKKLLGFSKGQKSLISAAISATPPMYEVVELVLKYFPKEEPLCCATSVRSPDWFKSEVKQVLKYSCGLKDTKLCQIFTKFLGRVSEEILTDARKSGDEMNYRIVAGVHNSLMPTFHRQSLRKQKYRFV